jgi:putative acetyltransferase
MIWGSDLFLEGMPAPDTTLHFETLASTSSRELVEIARELLREYGEFVLASTGPARFCAARLGPEIEHPVESYTLNGGELLLAFAGDYPAGCAGFRSLTADVPECACELKRMWVRPSFRGGLIGQRLVEAILEHAAGRGFQAIYLDTEPEAMPAALRLYLRMGFEECPAYTPQTIPGLRFLRRHLPSNS